MKRIMVSLIMLLVVGSGCERHTTIREVPMAVDQPVAHQQPAQSTVDGAVDGGGVNGLNGRPLESYHIDILDREEVKNTIRPLINEIAKVNVRFAAAMFHILRWRDWYMIPAPLSKIPASNIGVYFDNEQMALQSHKEIWIDSRKFDQLSDTDRVRLLIHEILMGMRIYRFTDDLEHCLVLATEKFLTASTKEYQQTRRACLAEEGRRNPIRTGGRYDDALLGSIKKLDLKTTDYTLIRNLTVRLLKVISTGSASGGVELTAEELDVWLNEAGLLHSPES